MRFWHPGGRTLYYIGMLCCVVYIMNVKPCFVKKREITPTVVKLLLISRRLFINIFVRIKINHICTLHEWKNKTNHAISFNCLYRRYLYLYLFLVFKCMIYPKVKLWWHKFKIEQIWINFLLNRNRMLAFKIVDVSRVKFVQKNDRLNISSRVL